jgi:hypothetical protein
MKYKVHQLEVKCTNFQETLEQFLNKLEGEILAVIPNVKPYFLCYGAKVNFVLIVEKTK